MADNVSRQAFQIDELPTKSVTLYPSRAHVIREIKNVTLSEGQNEIEIYGLSPTIDDQSVQVDGHGAATITDVTVELLDNKQSFQEVWDVEDDLDISDNEIEAYNDSDDDATEVKDIKDALADLRIQLDQVDEKSKSAWSGVAVLTTHSQSIDAKNTDPETLSKLLDVYSDQREALYATISKCKRETADLNKKLNRKQNELSAAKERERRANKVEQKAKQKALEAKQRRDAEKRKEFYRKKEEKLKFYPKKVYRTVVRLESSALMDTPASSRRNSIDAVTLTGTTSDLKGMDKGGEDGNTTAVNLSLSYVTSEASWRPHYDLTVSSTAKTATIVYRAELSNRTSETWSDAKVILSTSQTSFSGLDDKPPTLPGAFSIKLAKYTDHSDGGRLSEADLQATPQHTHQKGIVNNWNRNQFFGANNGYGVAPAHVYPVEIMRSVDTKAKKSAPIGGGLFGSSQPMASYSQAPGGNSNSLFASTQGSAAAVYAAQQMQMQGMNHARMAAVPPPPSAAAPAPAMRARRGVPAAAADSSADEDGEDMGYGAMLEQAELQPMAFDEGDWEDNGLTTTYEIPGTRSLVPSSTARRHKIARLVASNISLSYFAIPKMRASAYLRTKFKNPSSSITLLKGTTGITLDGSFLGNTSLPRSSPGQTITLPLGIDPGVQVSYQKPTVHRGSQGILFNKEAAHAFSRAIFLTNTLNRAIELVVLDQIPVSQDEKLRIEITSPKGLYRENDAVKAGSAAKDGNGSTSAVQSTSSMRGAPTTAVTSSGAKWGKAIAIMKKAGEVEYRVDLEKSQGCVLKLEYEASFPGNDQIVLAN